MRERHLMLLHYATGLGILVFGAIHVWVVFFTYPLQDTIWETTLQFDNLPFAVLPVYRNTLLALSLFGLLVCTTVHAINGLRVIIIELFGPRGITTLLTKVLIGLGAFLVIYGTRTILIANMIT
jgi:succinate dehydrogenase hydrophobic anchor subunit